MESKALFVLILIGGILGIFGGIFSIYYYFASKQFASTLGSMFGVQGMFANAYMLSLIFAIAHIVLALFFTFYSIKIAKNPTKTDFIIITILGAIGFLFAGMIFSGILILIGSIMGWVKIGKETQQIQQPISLQQQ